MQQTQKHDNLLHVHDCQTQVTKLATPVNKMFPSSHGEQNRCSLVCRPKRFLEMNYWFYFYMGGMASEWREELPVFDIQQKNLLKDTNTASLSLISYL